MDQGRLCPVITGVDHQLSDDINEPLIKTEGNDEDPINPFISEIIDEPNYDIFEPKSELITYESEINPDNKNNNFCFKNPEQNEYLLLKRLTSDEIHTASVPNHHSTLLKYEPSNLSNTPLSRNSSGVDTNFTGNNEIEKYLQIQPAATVIFSYTDRDLQFECKLCSKKFESDARLKIHVGICALYHEDRNRFCVICNRKFFKTNNLKHHRLRFHGTEEEKLSLFKFKCHLCPKQYQKTVNLRFHLQSHKETKEQVETFNLKLPMCSHPNCGKEFQDNSHLRRHLATHSDLRPFSCPFSSCNKKYRRKDQLKAHFLIHTGKRSYRRTVANSVQTYEDHQIPNEIIEPPVKVEVNDDEINNYVSSEIIEEPNVGLVELKREPITDEFEINPDSENNFFGLKLPEQNPYVLLKRLTSEEIKNALVTQHYSTLFNCEHENLLNGLEPSNSSDVYSNINAHNEVKNSTQIRPPASVEYDFLFECKLCSKQLESEAKLKIHVGICALYHKHRNRFCVICNRKLSDNTRFRNHRLRFHGTEEEKSSLFKVKCHLCPKQCREARDLRIHLKSHK